MSATEDAAPQVEVVDPVAAPGSDEPQHETIMDPAKLLPFTCNLEPDDPTVIRLPSAYIGTDEIIYGGSNYI